MLITVKVLFLLPFGKFTTDFKFFLGADLRFRLRSPRTPLAEPVKEPSAPETASGAPLKVLATFATPPTVSDNPLVPTALPIWF